MKKERIITSKPYLLENMIIDTGTEILIESRESFKEGKGYMDLKDKEGYKDALNKYDTFRKIISIAKKYKLEVINAEVSSFQEKEYLNIHLATFKKRDIDKSLSINLATKEQWEIGYYANLVGYIEKVKVYEEDFDDLGEEFYNLVDAYEEIIKLDLSDLPTPEYLYNGDTFGEEAIYVLFQKGADPRVEVYTSIGWNSRDKMKDNEGFTLSQAERKLAEWERKGWEDLEIVTIDELENL